MKEKQALASILNGFSDKQILKEFTRRFDCDGVILMYRDSDTESGLGEWRNIDGKNWVKSIFEQRKSKELNSQHNI